MTTAQLTVAGYVEMTEKDLKLYQRAPARTRRPTPPPTVTKKTSGSVTAPASQPIVATSTRQLRPKHKRAAEHTPPPSRPGKRARAASPDRLGPAPRSRATQAEDEPSRIGLRRDHVSASYYTQPTPLGPITYYPVRLPSPSSVELLDGAASRRHLMQTVDRFMDGGASLSEVEQQRRLLQLQRQLNQHRLAAVEDELRVVEAQSIVLAEIRSHLHEERSHLRLSTSLVDAQLGLPQQPPATPAIATGGPAPRPTHEDGDDDLYLPADPSDAPQAPPPTTPLRAPTPPAPTTPPPLAPQPLFRPSTPPTDAPDDPSPSPPVISREDRIDEPSLDVTASTHIQESQEVEINKEN